MVELTSLGDGTSDTGHRALAFFWHKEVWVGTSMAATWHPKVAQLSCHHAAVTGAAWLCHHSVWWAQVRCEGHARREGRGGASPSMGTGVLAFYILIILTFNASQLK